MRYTITTIPFICTNKDCGLHNDYPLRTYGNTKQQGGRKLVLNCLHCGARNTITLPDDGRSGLSGSVMRRIGPDK